MEASNLAKKWRVKPESLNAKLRNLTPGQALAVVDWIESCSRSPELTDKERHAVCGGPWLGVETVSKDG
jgi:hypothetical protein